jgi:hypothetical protein
MPTRSGYWESDEAGKLLKEVPYLDLVPYQDETLALNRLTRHQLDLLIQTGTTPRYWINTQSRKAFFWKMQAVAPGATRGTVAASYVPG